MAWVNVKGVEAAAAAAAPLEEEAGLVRTTLDPVIIGARRREAAEAAARDAEGWGRLLTGPEGPPAAAAAEPEAVDFFFAEPSSWFVDALLVCENSRANREKASLVPFADAVVLVVCHSMG